MAVKIKERDGKWWLYVDWHGQRKAKCIGTKEAAEHVKIMLEAKLMLGADVIFEPVKKPDHPAPPADEPKPLAEYTLTEYWERFAARAQSEIAEATFDQYKQKFTRYLKPHLGETKVREITRGAIRDVLVALRELGLSKRTAGMARATLSVILSDAADDGIVTSNPALELGRGRRKRADTQTAREKAEKVRPLTEQELELFLATAETKTPRFAAAFWCQARAGLRPSEAMALSLEDPDFAEAQLRVERTMYKQRAGVGKKGFARRVDMSPRLAARLREQVVRRKAQNLKRQWTSDLLCIGKTGEPLDLPNMGRAFRTVLKTAGISTQHSPYDLRHTFATTLLRKTKDLPYVARQLGHSRPTTTLQWYVHHVPELLQSGDRRRLVDVLDDVRPQPSATPAQPNQIGPLSEESATEKVAANSREKTWRRVDSNHGPRDYETLALAT
jgi:integrase